MASTRRIHVRIAQAHLLALATATVACASTVDERPRCELDADCSTGTCVGTPVGNRCMPACESDEDCDPGVRCVETKLGGSYCAPGCVVGCEDGAACGERPDGLPLCYPEGCAGSLEAGLTCIDGAPVTCETAGERASCRDCGCPDDQYCDLARCEPKGALGDPCDGHEECLSEHCGKVLGSAQCLVEVGSSCTDENCGDCVPLPSGSTECSESCDVEDRCGTGSDGAPNCWGNRDLGTFWCRSECGTSCPAGYVCRDVYPSTGPWIAYRCFPQ